MKVKSITNYELRIANFCGRAVIIFFLLGALCIFAGNSLAQTSLDALARQIARGGGDERKRDALAEIRRLETAEAARLAVPALRDKSEIVRAAAASSVIFLPPAESLGNLLPLLKDKKEFVRREAAYALGKTANPQAINALLQTFQTDKIGDVRNAAVIALGDIGDASAVEFLTAILRRKPKAEDEFLRRSAARSVGQIAQIIQTGRREVATPEGFLPDLYKQIDAPKRPNLTESFPTFRAAQTVLIQTLTDARESGDTRRESAFALGAIGDRAAIAVLQTNLNASDYYLAQICREALAKTAIYSNPKTPE